MESKRKDISLSDKFDVLKAIEAKKTQIQIAKEFGISQTQVSNIKKNSEKIIEDLRSNSNLDRKRSRKSNFDDLDEALMKWFSEKTGKGEFVNGPMIREKAQEIAMNSGTINFCASKGWLYRWQQRHNLKFKTLYSERGSMGTSVHDSWYEGMLDPIMEQYEPKDIFSCGETALYYRAMPSGTLANKIKKVQGYKRDKDRVTVLLCVNKTGNEKLPVLVIGKTKEPRCLKNTQNYPVYYTHSKNAWMTKSIFQKWLISLDMDMKKCNRKIVLFLNNVSSHNIDQDDVKLTNIKLQFLPVNMTCGIQPLDQGIIRSLKAMYRKQVIKEILHLLDETIDADSYASIHKKINLLRAMHFLKQAWDNVPIKVVQNSFKKAQFEKNENAWDSETVIYDFSELETRSSELHFSQEELDNYCEIDIDVETEGEEELLTGNFLTDDIESDEEEIEPPSMKDVHNSLCIIRRHFEANGGDYDLLYSFEKEIDKCCAQSFK